MKRAKSTICIKDLDLQIGRSTRQKSKHSKTPSLLPSSRSQSYLLYREMQKQADGKNYKYTTDNRIYCLQEQIVQLQQQIQSSKTSVKNYSKELAQYEQITNNIQRLEAKITSTKEKIGQLKNQLWMMRQQKQSTQFNAQQRVAEKQYFQQLIESYKREYEEESNKVMQIVQLEEKIIVMGRQIQELQKEISLSQNKLKQWKEENDFDLNQHKIKNSIKMARMELIRLEDTCDAHCNHYNLKRIRELCCQYFKIYAKKNGIGLEQAEEGVDLFFCKTGIVEEFRQFLSEKIIYNKPQCCEFDKYFETLLSIEKIYTSHRNKARENTHALQMYQVNRLKQLKQQKMSALNETRENIKSINAEIDTQFGVQSLAVIEYLRERNNNNYDIKEIKAKLKENKKELDRRVAQIKETCHKMKHLDVVIQKDLQPRNRSVYEPAVSCLLLQIKSSEQLLAALYQQTQKLITDKDRLQTFISDAVSKWRERQEKKDKLKQLYQQLLEAKQTNNYALTRNDKTIEEPTVTHNNMRDLSYSHKLVNRSSTSSLQPPQQSKSVLAFSNPFKTIMERQTNVYQPIIEDCQMILSKQFSKHKTNNNNLADTEKTKKVKGVVESIKKTILFDKSEKENLCENRTVSKNKSLLMSRTNYTISAKPSSVLDSHNKRKAGVNHKMSLSKLLMSKFNR